MNVIKYCGAIVLTLVVLYACNNDDDDSIIIVELRDRAEQQVDEAPIVLEYLNKHFYTLVDNPANPDYQIAVFDTIAGENSEQPSIAESDFLQSKTITVEDVDYTLYILNLNKEKNDLVGTPKPTFADSTLVTYRGEVFYDYNDSDGDGVPDVVDVDSDNDGEAEVDEIDGESVTRVDSDGDQIVDDSDADTDGVPGTDSDKVDSDGDGIIDEDDSVDNTDLTRRVFDNAVTPVWFDQVSVITGWREALVEVTGASDFVENEDGTVSYNMDFGNIIIFMPSGLGYFGSAQTGIPAYAPLIFQIQLYGVNEADHDNDGVPSYLEDIDGDRIVLDFESDEDEDDTYDDTDEDGFPNYIDTDDDGDGVLTIDEDLEPDTDLTVDRDGDGDPTNDIGDGDPTNDDSDGDGVPNYLDEDSTESRLDEED
ncbi:FKBP-type peptidyl-prolyl cis-trans isomerase [Aquimarina pacifica]|uniref:FKBP-type peptidyl-prolyl cis-trans isomerase n=1 Tax=Aquimarina pacifica TaxID=1296415 RepID=UPI000472BF35|nr:hypothetical protein [Aquimarina pacifica]